MRYELPPLPYDAGALAPGLSAESLAYHHDTLHRAYAENLKALIAGSDFEDRCLDDVVACAGDGPLYDNAAETWNHAFFWRCLSPRGGGPPSGPASEAIDASFGSFEAFQSAFNEAALRLFGSGWVWLVRTTGGTVNVQATRNACNPLRQGRIVLLGCDLWEHAYYVDYRNDKKSYLEAFWALVNWEFVNQRMTASL